MAGQKPRQGWIYVINPYRVSLRCKVGHNHIYDLNEPGKIYCKTSSCTQIINSSRVFRGEHPYIIWTSNEFQDNFNYIETFTAIPLTSSRRYEGLPTTYPINPTSRNELDKKSFALVHQICTIDANCFKNKNSDWLIRIGQIDKNDKTEVEECLKYFFNIQVNPSDDWFMENATPELLKMVFNNLPDNSKKSVLEELIDDVEF